MTICWRQKESQSRFRSNMDSLQSGHSPVNRHRALLSPAAHHFHFNKLFRLLLLPSTSKLQLICSRMSFVEITCVCSFHPSNQLLVVTKLTLSTFYDCLPWKKEKKRLQTEPHWKVQIDFQYAAKGLRLWCSEKDIVDAVCGWFSEVSTCNRKLFPLLVW